ncbi:fructose-2,6-bisphosphatase TIGAR-like [Diadema antillarum]|uniref:fructose-2,6-bisphosphatase TIGAR-like n=1 Tax=Diadema antillarum TaxID=105358 RepID=UPI003A88191C
MKFMLTFLRHGETEWNATFRCQGQSDVPLNNEGKEQAKRLGAYLSKEKFDYVYSSDLSRCLQTVKEVIDQGPNHDIEVIQDKRLRERAFGVYEGMSFDIYMQALRNCVGEFVIEGGETPEQVLARTIEFLHDMCKYVKTQETNKTNAAKSEMAASGAVEGGSAAAEAGGKTTSDVFVSEFTGENQEARSLPHVLLSTHGFVTRNFLKYLYCIVNVEIPEGDWLIDDGCPNTSLSTLVVETDKDDKFDFEKLRCYFIYKVDHLG